MKWIATIILLFIIYTESLAPIKAKWLQKDPIVEQIYKDHCIINENTFLLRTDERRTRKEVFHLAQPLLEIYLRDYTENYDIADSLSWALTCIFVSESSNGRGHSARSTLWLDHYNPFGMTTGKIGNTVTKMSWEMIHGRRVNMYRTFRTYDSLEQAVESLMWDFLLKGRYEKLRYSKTVKEFLYDLYDCGYMTNRYWPRFAYNEIYLKVL